MESRFGRGVNVILAAVKKSLARFEFELRRAPNPLKNICAPLAWLSLLGATVAIGGCAFAPNSFRITNAKSTQERIIYPPGAVVRDEKLNLYVETRSLECRKALPTRTSGSVTVSTPYWFDAGLRVLHIEVLSSDLSKIMLTPPARCLNVTVRRAAEQCPQDWIAGEVLSAIEKDEDWGKCIKKDTRLELAAEISEVLPHPADYSGAPREERTYARSPDPSVPEEDKPSAVSLLPAEIVSLHPGTSVCLNTVHLLVGNDPGTWISTPQSCVRLLEGTDGYGRASVARTDTEYTFPNADFFDDQGKATLFEARSWLAIRSVLTTLMPGGAYLYLYYSGKNDVSGKVNWQSSANGSPRVYVPTGEDAKTTPIQVSPILIVQSQPLKLTTRGLPTLANLCQRKGKIEKRCFAFPDFSSIDVLQPFLVDGQLHYEPTGTLTSDIPEISVERHPVATRLFRGRRVAMEFDVSNSSTAVPLQAGDQFGERP
ncbi:hypothetical protein [Pseudomonas fluorescens]|uniref:Uncharacterized protein n=1 Tax=Pseudomonas fluorescens TaxID=294 RepID=A0A944DJL4_PSEFL|nr:hypothetical protein [Pseudomonas fluorescens]MBT2298482.1 hypothetical protein [Pseudomonas fluorescens]MBT2310007.1 hypothetical protein [Pseudomonas fluorescens]MBT2311031.1 hypothetical protein [Pseudomonas fluorescens]MBT2320034.1 hypothetical protein [Pseudomonas fluorescens]MBT2328938.1 hypothetical protein [Pseudomonas fluorescens]